MSKQGAIVLLLLSILPGVYVFNFWCGCIGQDPIEVTVDNLNKLNYPPIVTYPTGDPPINVTTTSSTSADPANGHPLTAYQYWYLWGPTATHSANEWEPVYIIWDTANPTTPTLKMVITRFHFTWRQTAGTGLILNGTQPLISYGIQLGGVTWHVPIVRLTGLLNFFRSPNATLSIPVQQGSNWYYPVVNGGPHQELVVNDANSPYATGSQAYENDAGGNAAPVDPFSLYGTGTSFFAGILWGTIAVLVSYVFLSLDVLAIRKLRIRP